MSDPCPMCGGGMARRECVCGGTGKLLDAFNHVSEFWLKEKNEHEATKDSLKEIQKAVLGFVFHPVFRKLDRNGFFRKYWEDKLECKMTFSGSRPAAKFKPLAESQRQEQPRLSLYTPPSVVSRSQSSGR